MPDPHPLQKRYPLFESIARTAHVDAARFEEMSRRAGEDPEGFWGEVGKRIDWIKPYSRVKDVSFVLDDLHIRWYDDGTLNVCANCVDRHLDTRGDQTAILWEGDDPDRDAKITYRELYERVCRFANVLKRLGVGKGDRVTLYLPMIPEAAVAMLACARIGAVHSVVFGGFSPDALVGRIVDCDSRIVVTADTGLRGGRSTGLKTHRSPTDAGIEFGAFGLAGVNPAYSSPFRREGLSGPVAGAFCDRARRKRSHRYGEDARPSETAQTRGLTAPQ